VPTPEALEDFLASTKNFVESFLEVCSAFSKLLPDLGNILLKALFYLLAKELLQGAVAKTFRVLRRMIGDDVRDERASESLGTLVGIL
jgi:hypothetical protein